MTRRKPVVMLGASGHALVVADILSRAGIFVLKGVFDDDVRLRGTGIGGARVLGPCREAVAAARRWKATAIVAVGDNAARRSLSRVLAAAGVARAVAIHPAAVIAPDVTVGPGTVIMATAVINPGSRVHEDVIVNTGSTIDHECVLEDGCHISPGANLAGRVRVGSEAHVGIGAAVLPGLSIGPRAVVGGGAVVVGDVRAGAVVIGVPARPLRRR